MLRLRFTTLVEAPLTVAFDVARALGRPWPVPLEEVVSVRPERDVYAARVGRGWVAHSRRYTATGAGTLVDEQVDWSTGLPRGLAGPAEQTVLRRRLTRAMQAYLDGYAAAAAQRAHDVVQVVGAALVRDDVGGDPAGSQVLVAQRAGGPYDGRWEFPGGKVEPGEAELDALAREIREELGVAIAPQAFLGEVVLDGAVGGGAPGASTMRVWWALLAGGELVAREHAQLRWARAEELAALDWIPADRPLLPSVGELLVRL